MTAETNADDDPGPRPAPDWFHQYLQRTIAMLGPEAVEALRPRTVAIAGCGGHGGAAALTLARMGIEGFHLADPHPFDEPDLNRQWGATRATLGRNKARVYEEMLGAINPGVRVRVFDDGVTTTNVAAFLDGADFLVDCLDVAVPAALRTQLLRAARTRGIHAATGANLGFGGMIALASPDGLPLELLGGVEDDAIQGGGLPPFADELFIPQYLRVIERSLPLHRVPSIAPAPTLLGALLSVEVLAALLGAVIPGWRPPLCLPKVLCVDLLRMSYRVVDLEALTATAVPTPGSGDAAPASCSRPPGRFNQTRARAATQCWPRPDTTRTSCPMVSSRLNSSPTAGASFPHSRTICRTPGSPLRHPRTCCVGSTAIPTYSRCCADAWLRPCWPAALRLTPAWW